MKLSREQTEAIIKNGQSKGLNGKAILDGLIQKGYEPEGIDVNLARQALAKENGVQTSQEDPNIFERVKTGIEQKGEKIVNTITDPTLNPLEAGAKATATGFSALSSTAYNVLPEKTRNALDQVAGGIGKGFSYLTDKISNSQFLQEAMQGDTKNLETALNIASDLGLISGEILGAKTAQSAGKAIDTGIQKTIDAAKSVVPKVTEQVFKVGENVLPKSPEIMNRVARLKPSDATKFKNMVGKTQGEYLTETNNFGAPDKIIAKEAQNFTKSLNAVDDGLSKIKGNFKTGAVDDALDELFKKATSESSKNIKSPYLNKVLEFQTKNNTVGLTMSEINEVKRLFEKNVRLGYNKMLNPEKVAQATNIDSALRNWQVKTASELGFTDLAQLNKQTQISKFLIDKLGDQVVGQNGLNGVSLTDWIMLSGGSPTSVAGFLTKKFFSSKNIQAKIAEMLKETTVSKTPTQSVLQKGLQKPYTSSVAQKVTEGNIKLAEQMDNADLLKVGQKTKGTTGMAGEKALSAEQLMEIDKKLNFPAYDTGKTIDLKKIKLDKGATEFLKKEPSSAVLKEMENFLDYTRLKKLPEGFKDVATYEVAVRDILKEFKVLPDVSNATIAKFFEAVLNKAK